MSVDASPHRPLSGYRVLDLSSVMMGPLATQILADLGADVIAVERPDGDPNRYMGVGPHPEFSGAALNLMRNKRSVVVDPTLPAGREAFERLVSSSDVFVTNLRPASRRRARLCDEDLRLLRPDLIYCSATGFAPDDPRADAPAYDDVIQSAAGLVDMHHRAGLGPTYSPTVLADKVVGMAIAQAVTAALLHRERTGEGQSLSVSMYEVVQAFVLVEHGAAAIPEPPLGRAGSTRMLNASRCPVRTSDGIVGILVYERHHFENIARLAGRDDLIDDPRFVTRAGRLEHLDAVYDLCGVVAASMTTGDFLAACATRDIPAHRVVPLDEVVESLPITTHPHAGSYRQLPSLAPGRSLGASLRRPAPLIGEHTDEVLAELGCSPSPGDGASARP